jgi:hypothetical protein
LNNEVFTQNSFLQSLNYPTCGPKDAFEQILVSYSWHKQNMMSPRGQASWAKMTSPGGQANSTDIPPNQKSEESWEMNLGCNRNGWSFQHELNWFWNSDFTSDITFLLVKLTAPAYHLTKKVNKAEKLTLGATEMDGPSSINSFGFEILNLPQI